jgi:hypothetical protein
VEFFFSIKIIMNSFLIIKKYISFANKMHINSVIHSATRHVL